MAKAVFKTQRGFKVGEVSLGQHGKKRGSVKQQVHDGDTVIVNPNGNCFVPEQYVPLFPEKGWKTVKS